VRRSLLLLLLCVGLVLPSSPAGGRIRNGREAIGDSVMLGAKEELSHRGVRVDAVVSRQFRDAVALVRSRDRAGTLRRKVIIHLGTNGILIHPDDCDAISRIAGRDRQVFLVTNTGPTSYPSIRRTQNQRLAACARRHANTSLLGWYAYSRGHGSWFYGDGMHLTGSGQQAYARFVHERTS